MNTDSKYLGVSSEEVWVCGYVHVCAPLWGEELGALHGLHIWEERGSAQGEVRSCFSISPKEIRKNKLGFKKIFLFMKVEKYSRILKNSYLWRARLTTAKLVIISLQFYLEGRGQATQALSNL